MTTGEEEPCRKSWLLRKSRDTTVSNLIVLLYITHLVQMKGLSKIRIGEEEEITNLMDYLKNSTTKY